MHVARGSTTAGRLTRSLTLGHLIPSLFVLVGIVVGIYFGVSSLLSEPQTVSPEDTFITPVEISAPEMVQNIPLVETKMELKTVQLAQSDESGIVTPATIPIVEVEWTQTSELPSNPNLRILFDEKMDWFHEQVLGSIERDPPFLIPGVPKGRGTDGRGLAWLIADGDVWFTSVIDITCIKPCSNGELGKISRFTYRLVVSLDAGLTWMELLPPAEYHQGDLGLRGIGGRKGIVVFDEGDQARFIIITAPVGKSYGKDSPIYQTMVTK